MKNDFRVRKLPPVWFIRGLDAFRTALIRMNRRLFPSQVVLYEQFQNFWLLPCLKVAAELGLADILQEGPRTPEELAVQVGADPGSLARVLRALASQGIFRRLKDGRYTNSRLSRPLGSGKDSVRSMILHHLGKVNWNLLGELSYSVRTGKEAFPELYGKEVYDFLSERKDEFNIFDRSMSDLSRMSVDPILNAYDFSRFSVIADIGGGEGMLLSAVLSVYPGTRGILLDLPDPSGKARELIRKAGLAERIRMVEGSFFDLAPPAADAYILKNVLHNWGEEECLCILGKIRESIPQNGMLLVVEMIVNRDQRPSFAKMIDIQMMVMNHGARERTLGEFEGLISRAGFRLVRVVPTIAPLSILECKRR